MVLIGHKNTDCSREKMRTLEQRKVSAGKDGHDFKMLQEYMKG